MAAAAAATCCWRRTASRACRCCALIDSATGDRRDRRLALRRHARRRPGLARHPGLPRQGRATSATATGSAELTSDEQAAPDPGRPGPRGRRRARGAAGRPHHVWSLWTRYACTAFYSHPWAWNEIGFGGPGLSPRLPQSRGRRPRTVGGRRPTTRRSTPCPSPSGSSGPARADDDPSDGHTAMSDYRATSAPATNPPG